MNNLTPHATRMRKKLVKDPTAYLEAVGKHDNAAFETVLTSLDGKGTAIRLFLGAAAIMPVRALTYVASAARLATLIPAEQLQIISVNTLGEAVNKIPRMTSVPQFERLTEASIKMLTSHIPEVVHKTVFALDTETPAIAAVRPHVEAALQQNRDLLGILATQGQRHGGDFLTYTAAHTVFQDTDKLQLEPLAGCSPIAPERIVSIGCQKEKDFYVARLAVRSLMGEEECIPSVQVFTQHVLPPYFQCKEGEQSLEDATTTQSVLLRSGSHSVQRDLRHFQDILAAVGACHE